MSEGSITYQTLNEPCGITTVINSQLRNHRVCSDGLACVLTAVEEGSTGKQCQTILTLEGERCNPFIDSCVIGLDCIHNYDDIYTCGGVSVWDGNEPYVMSGYVSPSSFQINVLLVILGVLVMVLYMLLLTYEFVVKGSPSSIYSNVSGGGRGVGNDWIRNAFRHLSSAWQRSWSNGV